jgi:hypothetical protein
MTIIFLGRAALTVAAAILSKARKTRTNCQEYRGEYPEITGVLKEIEGGRGYEGKSLRDEW